MRIYRSCAIDVSNVSSLSAEGATSSAEGCRSATTGDRQMNGFYSERPTAVGRVQPNVEAPIPKYANATNSSWWIVQTNLRQRTKPEVGIPPTAVGGSFKSSLTGNPRRATRKSHQRQLVDRSNPTYDPASPSARHPSAARRSNLP